MEKCKKIRIVLTAVIMTVFMSKTVNAQFTLSGEFRPRTEFNHGYKALAGEEQDLSTITAQRSRLNFIYNSEFVKTKLTLQDVRLFGSQPQLVTNEDFATSVHEAWAEIFFNKEISLKIGRQEVIYDDHRIFGSVAWIHQARSHDLAVLKYEGKLKLHLGIAHHENNQINNDFYNGLDAYKDLQFLWANTKVGPSAISFLALNKGNNMYAFDTTGTSETKYTQTIGPRIQYNKDKLGIAAYFYYQTGDMLSAYNFSAEIFYKVSDALSATLGYEMLSGNDTTTADQEAFTPFFGTNHKFNGFMDYFYVGNHMGSVGLSDIYVKCNYVNGKSAITGHGHIFSAATDNFRGFEGKNLGVELDLVYSYKLSDISNLSIGYSQMFGGDNMAILKGGSTSAMSYWGWVMLTVKPEFFTTKKSE